MIPSSIKIPTPIKRFFGCHGLRKQAGSLKRRLNETVNRSKPSTQDKRLTHFDFGSNRHELGINIGLPERVDLPRGRPAIHGSTTDSTPYQRSPQSPKSDEDITLTLPSPNSDRGKTLRLSSGSYTPTESLTAKQVAKIAKADYEVFTPLSTFKTW